MISSNRPDGVTVAQHIHDDFAGGAKASKPGRPALEKLLAERKARIVSFADWKRLEAAETEAGGGTRPRKKFTTVQDMLDFLDRNRN